MPEREVDKSLRAAALHYSGDGGAPKVTAAGRGHVAARILAVAEESGVPIREDAALVEALAQLDLGREIPEDLWKAAAEALAWAYKLDGTAAARRRLGP